MSENKLTEHQVERLIGFLASELQGFSDAIFSPILTGIGGKTTGFKVGTNKITRIQSILQQTLGNEAIPEKQRQDDFREVIQKTIELNPENLGRDFIQNLNHWIACIYSQITLKPQVKA